MTANVKNYVDPTNGDGDNKVHLEGTLVAEDTEIDSTKVKNVMLSNDISIYDSGTTHNMYRSGYALIDGGIGFGGFPMENPEPGALANIKLRSITAGSVIIQTAPGITWDGTNKNAIFDVVDNELIVGYKSDTEWEIYTNNGVVLSP